MKRSLVIAGTVASLVAFAPHAVDATGIPVIDVSNLAQNLVTALKSVSEYAKQVQQYQLQLQQYEEQVKQGLAPVAYVWQQARQTMGQLQSAYAFLQGGTGLQQYLGKFQDVNYYENIGPGGWQPQTAGSVAQKQTNDAWVRALQAHQQQLQQDATNLERLQTNAESSQGQMQAIQAANQLAALQAKQLMEIQALLVQEQQALAARQQTLANDEAMRQAASDKFFQSNYQSGPPVYYSPTKN
jgi:P-type conjugative transfer protein TrbJ